MSNWLDSAVENHVEERLDTSEDKACSPGKVYSNIVRIMNNNFKYFLRVDLL